MHNLNLTHILTHLNTTSDLSTPLGALMVFFRADEQGNIACATFLMMFLKIGFDERQDRTNLYRKQEADLAEWRTKEALSKAKQAEAKLVLRVKGINVPY